MLPFFKKLKYKKNKKNKKVFGYRDQHEKEENKGLK
jgi:hypothetical protein